MGYRSDVAIACQKNAYKKIKEAYEKGYVKPDRLLKNDPEGLIMVCFNDIKWFNGYEDIDAIEDVLNELDEGDEDDIWEAELGYHFLRIGEDYGDVEERANTWDIDLYFTREIDTFGYEPLVQ